jgi:hypothetical protein
LERIFTGPGFLHRAGSCSHSSFAEVKSFAGSPAADFLQRNARISLGRKNGAFASRAAGAG